MNEKYYLRFPSVLKDAIQKRNLKFPDETLWQYEPQMAFRGIVRKPDDDLTLKKSDFLSYAELGRRPRGGRDNISWYSCSCSKSRKELEAGLKLPRPNRRIIQGIINDNKGCIYITPNTGHIDWWIYDNVNPEEGFEVIRNE